MKHNGNKRNPTIGRGRSRWLLAVGMAALAFAWPVPGRADEPMPTPARARPVATPVRSQPEVAAGTIASIHLPTRTIVVSNLGQSQTFHVAPDADIAVKDKHHASLNDLMVGDKVLIHYTEENGTLVAHQIAPARTVDSVTESTPLKNHCRPPTRPQNS